MLEFVFMGRGGQGVVLAEEILAKTLFYQGFHVKAFPFFGTERRGAPVTAFLRVSEEEIRESCQIYRPDYYIVFHPSQALPAKARGVVNTHLEISGELVGVDATQIALKNGLGTHTNPIINTSMIGAVAGLIPELDFENLEKGITSSLAPHLWKKNIRAAWDAYETVATRNQIIPQWSLICG